jgi:hypothetical protein
MEVGYVGSGGEGGKDRVERLYGVMN